MGGAARLLGLLASPFPYRPSFALRLARRSGIPLVAISPAIASSSSLLTRRRSFLLTSLPRVHFGFPFKASAEVHTQAAASGHAWGRAYHPWPEWSNLVEHLVAGGYSDCRQEPSGVTEDDDDCFASGEDLTEEFVDAAKVCLCFARDGPELLRLLPMKEIEIILENCSPILFRNGANSIRRLKSYVSGDKTNVPCSDTAVTVDLMRYLLSNVWKSHIKENDHIKDGQLIERSSRFLLAELVKINVARHEQRPIDLDSKQAFVQPELNSQPPGLNMEMKRGDWVCPKCSFMNFARNARCLECNEARPKRVLTGGEWECPQCDFFNYGRNMSCLRCDCRRPGDAASHDGSGCYGSSTVEQIVKASDIDNFEIKRKLAANDEKAERWFSKMSQIGDNADLNSAIADEDFPEIMPMRKGVNRFVVSTRKTPLERRLANGQNNRSSSNSDLNRKDSNNSTESSIRQSLDRILGRSTTLPGMNNESVSGGSNTGTGGKFSSPDYIANQGDRGYVPFVPLPADMFNKSQNINNEQSHTKEYPTSLKASMLKSSENTSESKNGTYLSNSGQIWHTKTEGLDNVMDKANRIPNNGFQEVTPMQKGESLSLKSRRDQPFTSPQYKRRTTVEQANSSDFVPFVPFPPDYFAKKDKQTDAAPTVGSASEGSAMPEKIQSVPQKWEESTHAVPKLGFVGSNRFRHPDIGSTSQSNGTPRTNYSLQGSREHWGDAVNSARSMDNNSSNHSATWSSGYSRKSSYADGSASHGSSQQGNRQNSEESWTPKFTGKSLEGSAVSKEPDPLDMSEEAKAARWFRRVAQIKDISELSSIPDEDFPEIMPMRKGVNRFVVSKRKTPLERRLTSPQYRRNLPIISSDPEKDTQQKDD